MSKKHYLPRKDSIILSAIEIINDVGIHELSVRELANRQNVTEPALYRHFKSKQEILAAVLDYYSGFDAMIADSIIQRNLNAKDAIIFFMRSFAENFENYPPLTAISMAYDLLGYDTVLGPKIKAIFLFRLETLTRLIAQGQANREITANFQPEDLAQIILGMGDSIILHWRIHHYEYSLKARLLKSLEALLVVC